MSIKCNPVECKALILYKGSLITIPVCNAEPTNWISFIVAHSYLQEVGGCIEVDITRENLSRYHFHKNLLWFPPNLHNTAF
jgi:hypothetical protein